MSEELVLSRIDYGEDVRTSFRRDIKDGDDIAKTICAFLNGDGGVLFCGIEQDGEIIGVPRTFSKKALQSVELKIKALITPSALVALSVEEIDGKRVATIEAPAGNDRPYVCKGVVWVRDGSRTEPADASKLRALVKGQVDAPQRWERKLSPAMTQEDLDRSAVRNMMASAIALARFHFEKKSEMEALRQIAMWTPEGFTQGADVLFSTTPWRRHPQCRVQWVEFDDTKAGDVYVNHNWLQGPLVEISKQVFVKLDAINKVRARFRPNLFERSEALMYSNQALREGIVNALVHRDYASYSGGMKVSVYPNRVEIWNSGRLPPELEVADLKKDHPSILVNPDMTHVFYIAGLMEGIGRGTQKIVADSKRLGARPPKWTDAPSGVTLTIFAATGAVEDSEADLNDRQRALIERVKVGESVSLATYIAMHPQVGERQLRRDLVDLVESGDFRREGRARATTYRRVRSSTPKK